jgi:hypothetical protein
MKNIWFIAIAVCLVLVAGATILQVSKNTAQVSSVPKVQASPEAKIVLVSPSPTTLQQKNTVGAPSPTPLANLKVTVDAPVQLTAVANAEKAGESVTVADDQSQFSSTTPYIYLTVFVENKPTGGKALTDMEYLKTHEVLGPVSAVLTKTSQGQMAKFRFSKPTKGWKTGQYGFVISVTGGENLQKTITIK